MGHHTGTLRGGNGGLLTGLVVTTAVEVGAPLDSPSSEILISFDTLRVSSLDAIVLSACDAAETDGTTGDSSVISAACLTATEEIVRGGNGGGAEREGGGITSDVRDNGATS